MNNVVSRIRFSSFVVAQQYYIHQKILYYYKKRIGAERTPGVENEQPQIDRPTGWHGGSKFISPPVSAVVSTNDTKKLRPNGQIYSRSISVGGSLGYIL